MREKILIVEDEAAIAESVAYALRTEGYDVQIAEDGLAGLSAVRTFGPGLIILDLMLPKLGGFDFTRLVRKESSVPIIMLTVKTEEIDKVVGLELGADDYVTKPFGMRELLARVKAVLRRIETARKREDEQYHMRVGRIEMDVARRVVKVNGEEVHLPLKQFELLKVLMANKDRVLTREELIKAVWDTSSDSESGSLDVHVRWLREKIEENPSRPVYIRTVRGIGYRIVDIGEE